MAGRFPLLTDENVGGPLIRALRARGWDLVRALDVFGENTDDDVLFAWAAEQGRVFVTDDRPAEAVAIRWLAAGRAFRGMIRCPQQGEMSTGELLADFDELAAKSDPFAGYPIIYLKPKR